MGPVSVTPFSIDKAAIAHLQDTPRDIFLNQQAITGAARVYRNISVDNYGIGLDLVLMNAATAVAAATVIIDNQRTVSVPINGSIVLNNIVFISVEVPAQVGIALDIFIAGASNELLTQLVKK